MVDQPVGNPGTVGQDGSASTTGINPMDEQQKHIGALRNHPVTLNGVKTTMGTLEPNSARLLQMHHLIEGMRPAAQKGLANSPCSGENDSMPEEEQDVEDKLFKGPSKK